MLERRQVKHGCQTANKAYQPIHNIVFQFTPPSHAPPLLQSLCWSTSSLALAAPPAPPCPPCCSLSAGPLAVLHLPHHLPGSLHGSFSTEYLGPDPSDETVPRWKEVARYRALA